MKFSTISSLALVATVSAYPGAPVQQVSPEQQIATNPIQTNPIQTNPIQTNPIQGTNIVTPDCDDPNTIITPGDQGNFPLPPNGCQDIVTVQQNDSLENIAIQRQLDVNDVIRANPQLQNPDLIQPGQQVCIPGNNGFQPPQTFPGDQGNFPLPPNGCQDIVTAQKNDSLESIAIQRQLDVNDVIRANPEIQNPDCIQPGQQICIPGNNGFQQSPQDCDDNTQQLPTPQVQNSPFDDTITTIPDQNNNTQPNFDDDCDDNFNQPQVQNSPFNDQVPIQNSPIQSQPLEDDCDDNDIASVVPKGGQSSDVLPSSVGKDGTYGGGATTTGAIDGATAATGLDGTANGTAADPALGGDAGLGGATDVADNGAPALDDGSLLSDNNVGPQPFAIQDSSAASTKLGSATLLSVAFAALVLM